MFRCFEKCKSYVINSADGTEGLKHLDLDITLPKRSTENAAGYDFFAMSDKVIPSIWKGLFKNLITQKPIKPTMVWTGVKARMLKNEYLAVHNRSSNPWKKGLILANGVGVVDSDYYNNPDNDGDIGFAFYNIFPFDVTIHKGDKIGQGVFHKFLRVDSDYVRRKRTGGFGSTGS